MMPLVLPAFAGVAALLPQPGPGPSASVAAVQDPGRTLTVSTVEGNAPRLDGQLGEQAWADAELADAFVQVEPAPGEPARERTEVAVLLSGDALYIGARLYDGNPSGIRRPLARRDEDVASDWFYVHLDTNRDRTTVAAFGVNPRGVKRDFLVLADGREDAAWQAVWDAAVSVDSLGWVVELRIPLSQLRLEGSGGQGASPHWGINFERRVARTGEVSSWIEIPANRRRLASSLGDLIGMEDAPAPLRLEVLPYSMVRASDPGDGPEARNVFGTAGGDLRLGLPGSLTLRATFNPDFGQVEADPAVVNVSGYRTFFPERRPFFLEDQDFLSHQVGSARILHTRRIGRDVDAAGRAGSSLQAVPDASGILAATAVTGRTPSGWSAGFMHAVTNSESRAFTDSIGVEAFEPVQPRTHYLMGRLGRDVRDGQGTLGGLFTLTRRGLSGGLSEQLVETAAVAGVTWDGLSRDRTVRFSASFLGSQVSGSSPAIDALQGAHGRYLGRPDARHVSHDPDRTRLTGFAGHLSLERLGTGNWSSGVDGAVLSPGFEVNDLGYQREADVVQQAAWLGYDRVGDGIVLRRRRLNLTQWSEWTLGGERTGTGGRAELQLQLRNFWGGVFQWEAHLPHLSTDQLRGGPALQMPASTRQRVVLYTDTRRALTLRLDGSRTQDAEAGGTLRVLRATVGARPAGVALLTLEPSLVERVGTLEYVARRTADGEDVFVFGEMYQRTLSLVLRLDLALSPDLSLQWYAQPYLVDRHVEGFREVMDPRAASQADRFRSYGPEEVRTDVEPGRIHIDRGADGRLDFSLPDPSFSYAQLSSNLVLRWEYRPASTLYIAWGHDFRSREGPREVGVLDGLTGLLGLRGQRDAPAANVLLLKLTFWLSP